MRIRVHMLQMWALLLRGATDFGLWTKMFFVTKFTCYPWHLVALNLFSASVSRQYSTIAKDFDCHYSWMNSKFKWNYYCVWTHTEHGIDAYIFGNEALQSNRAAVFYPGTLSSLLVKAMFRTAWEKIEQRYYLVETVHIQSKLKGDMVTLLMLNAEQNVKGLENDRLLLNT